MNIICISGLPATGKTYLSKKISQKFNIPLITKDTIKESLFDSFKTENISSLKLGIASFNLLYSQLEENCKNNITTIIEGNFSPKYAQPILKSLQDKYNALVLEVFCSCNTEILVTRFQKRALSTERHPCHFDPQYSENFKEYIEKTENSPISIDNVIKYDSSFFSEENTHNILEQIRYFI